MRVTLYEKPGCGLCAEALEALTRVAREVPLTVERVDITTDALLERRFALRIPVAAVGEAELDLAGLPDAPIARWLEANG